MNISNRIHLFHLSAIASIIALIVLGGAWERYLAPLHPGGSILSLKILPLLPILWGMLQGWRRAFQWSVLVVWLYVAEGSTRLWTDHGLSQHLAGFELFLALLLFTCSTLWIRTKYPRRGQSATT